MSKKNVMGVRSLKLFGLPVFEYRSELKNLGSLSQPTSDGISILSSQSKSGTNVNETTAMTYAPVFSCVRVISEALATMPLKPFYKDDKNKTIAKDTAAYQLLALRPNAFNSPSVFKDMMTATVILWGNSFAYIRRIGTKPIELEYIHPTKIEILEDKESRQLFYKLIDYGITVPATDMIHLRGLGTDKIGKSIIRYQMDTLGLGMGATDSTNEFFKNGAMVSGILSSDGNMTKEQRQNNKVSWDAAHSGTGNRMGTAVLGGGMKYQRIGIPPAEGQFLETQKYSALQTASIFKVPAFMIQAGENKFKDIQELNNWFLSNTLLPWIIRWEEELNQKIFTIQQRSSGRYYTKFNTAGLMRANKSETADFYTNMWNIGAYSINEIRDLEDQNPIDGGDDHYIPANNMVPIDLQKEHIEAQIQSLNKKN